MTYSNFSNGFSGGVLIRGLPVMDVYPGKVFWVGNNATRLVGEKNATDADLGGKGGSFLQPFSTLSFAISQCAEHRGDIIFVRAEHAETISTAAGINLSKAGVSIVGLGRGSCRPTINITATGAYLSMSAASCVIQNFLFTGGIDAIAKMISVSASDCVIDGCELRDVTGQMTLGILTTAAADRLKVLNHVHKGDTAAGTVAGIRLVGGTDIEITIDRMDGNFSTGGIDVATTAATNLFVHDVKSFRTRNSADIFLVDTITGSTGQVGPNINIRLQDNAANITEAITGATFVVMDPVYVVNAAGEKGMLIDWTASTNA